MMETHLYKVDKNAYGFQSSEFIKATDPDL